MPAVQLVSVASRWLASRACYDVEELITHAHMADRVLGGLGACAPVVTPEQAHLAVQPRVAAQHSRCARASIHEDVQAPGLVRAGLNAVLQDTGT